MDISPKFGRSQFWRIEYSIPNRLKPSPSDGSIIQIPPETMSSKNIVYLLHFDRRICASRTTQHYIGWTNNLDDRLWEHSRGKGSRLCAVARQRDIRFILAECWIGDRALERQLKRYKNAPRLCPICHPAGSKKSR
jgi:predicted GIY-YIG superfamily endonuclease